MSQVCVFTPTIRGVNALLLGVKTVNVPGRGVKSVIAIRGIKVHLLGVKTCTFLGKCLDIYK